MRDSLWHCQTTAGGGAGETVDWPMTEAELELLLDRLKKWRPGGAEEHCLHDENAVHDVKTSAICLIWREALASGRYHHNEGHHRGDSVSVGDRRLLQVGRRRIMANAARPYRGHR